METMITSAVPSAHWWGAKIWLRQHAGEFNHVDSWSSWEMDSMVRFEHRRVDCRRVALACGGDRAETARRRDGPHPAGFGINTAHVEAIGAVAAVHQPLTRRIPSRRWSRLPVGGNS